MIQIFSKSGEVVRKSKSLRGLIDHAREESVSQVRVLKLAHGAIVFVGFENGDNCRADFASYSVAMEWLRRKNFVGAKLVIDGRNVGEIRAKNSRMAA